MNNKIARFLAEHSPETPCLIVDLDLIAEAYDLLSRYLSVASVYYAVKANPAPEIVAMLAAKGANFDVASPAEIALCLGNGAAAAGLSFGNTIKKERDIAFAYDCGVRLFAFDSECELEKLARCAPGARVRLRCECVRCQPRPPRVARTIRSRRVRRPLPDRAPSSRCRSSGSSEAHADPE